MIIILNQTMILYQVHPKVINFVWPSKCDYLTLDKINTSMKSLKSVITTVEVTNDSHLTNKLIENISSYIDTASCIRIIRKDPLNKVSTYEYLRTLGVEPHPRLFFLMVTEGKLDLLKSCIENRMDNMSYHNIIMGCLVKRSLSALEILGPHHQVFLTSKIICKYVNRDFVEGIKYLIDFFPMSDNDIDLILKAAVTNCNRKLIEYFIGLGGNINSPSIFIDLLLRKKSLNDKIEILEYLVENGMIMADHSEDISIYLNTIIIKLSSSEVEIIKHSISRLIATFLVDRNWLLFLNLWGRLWPGKMPKKLKIL